MLYWNTVSLDYWVSLCPLKLCTSDECLTSPQSQCHPSTCFLQGVSQCVWTLQGHLPSPNQAPTGTCTPSCIRTARQSSISHSKLWAPWRQGPYLAFVLSMGFPAPMQIGYIVSLHKHKLNEGLNRFLRERRKNCVTDYSIFQQLY